MFKQLCLHLIVALCWQHVTSRHLVQPNYHHSLPQPFYLPQSDYSYSSSSAYQPYLQPYPQSPLYSPPGTYFDQRRGILRPFPGGGVPVLVDYHKRCSNQYVGLKAHPEQHQYYYVCKPDCVIFGKCQHLQNFNSTSGQCAQHPAPEYIPTCSSEGRFPLFSDCHLYYKCEEDLKPKIYSCPAHMIFSPASNKCITGNKCTPTQISPHSSHIPECCTNKFPPCYENGIFRSPADCSLYYKCELQRSGVYMQTRLRCPTGNFYDIKKHECLPQEQVPCDCIQVAELVYPKPNTVSYQPAMYPAEYDFHSLEENSYPVEQTEHQEININCDINESKNESKSESENESFNDSDNDSEPEQEVPTTVTPLNSDTTLTTELGEQNVLFDFLDIENDNAKPQSGNLDQVAQNFITTTVSAEELSSIEGSGSEKVSEDITTLSPEAESTTIANEDTNDINVTIENEKVQPTDATTDANEEITDKPDVLTEELEIETFDRSEEVEDDKIEPCESIIESIEQNDKSLPTDKHNIAISQKQTKTCPPKLANISLDSEPTRTTLVSEINRGSRSTIPIHEQNLTTATTNTTATATATTQLPNIITIPTSDNLETAQAPLATALDFDKARLGNEPLETNLLDSETNLETAETTQSSNSPVADTQTFQVDTRLNEDDKEPSLLATDNDRSHFKHSKQFSQTITERSLEISSASDDVTFKDLLDVLENETALALLHTTTKQPLVKTTVSAQPFREEEEDSAPQSTIKNIVIESSPIPLDHQEFSGTEKPPEAVTLNAVIPQTINLILDSTTTTLKPNSAETTDFIMDNKFDLLDSKLTTDNFESSTQTAEKNLQNNSLENEEFLTNQKQHNSFNEKSDTLIHADFSDEEFLPVHSKSTVMNGLPDDATDINMITDSFEEDTTDINDNETKTITPVNGNPQASKEHEKSKQEQEEKKDDDKTTTTLKRRQISSHETTQLTTATPTIEITLAAEPSATITESPITTNEAEDSADDDDEDLLAVLGSEVIQHDRSDEVSNNKTTSAETTQTTIETSNVKQQFPQTHSTTSTPTQTPKITPKYINNTTNTTSDFCAKHSNNLVLHVREADPSLDSPSPSKSLYYILKTKPVINKNNSTSINNKICNETVAASPCIGADNEKIPRLEIIAERPIDIRFSICPPTCDKDHKHNYSPTSNHAVFLKWFAKKSKQTMGFETVNEVNITDDQDSS